MEEPDRAAVDKAREPDRVVVEVKAVDPDRVAAEVKAVEPDRAAVEAKAEAQRRPAVGWALTAQVAEGAARVMPTKRPAHASARHAAGRFLTDGGFPAWTRNVPIAM